MIEVNDLSSGQYSVSKNMFKTSMLRSNICGYSDAYIVVNRRITVEGDNYAKKRNKKLVMLHLYQANQKSMSHL